MPPSWGNPGSTTVTGGDPQPIRLQVRVQGCTCKVFTCAVVVHTGVACTGVACAGVVGTLNQSMEPIRVAFTGVACAGVGDTQPISGANQGCMHKDCMHKGCACNGCT